MKDNKKQSVKRRAKGSGSIVNIRGRWAVRWMENGVRKQEVTEFRVGTKADKERAMKVLQQRTELNVLKGRRARLAVLINELKDVNDRIAELERARDGIVAEERKYAKVGDLGAIWERSPRRKDHSASQVKWYLRLLRMFSDWCGHDVSIRDVDDAKADEYAQHLVSRKISNTTYNKHVNALDLAWKVVWREAECVRNPWSGIARKNKDSHSRRAYTHEETDLLLSAAEGEMKMLIQIGLLNGLRLKDACLLTWEKVRSGTLATSKTGAVVPLLPRLSEALGSDEGRCGYVLPEMASLYVRDPTYVTDRMTALLESCGIESSVEIKGRRNRVSETGFHALRHTFATRAVAEDLVPVDIVRAMMGHTTTLMTDHYAHVGAIDVLKAFEAAKKHPKV